jgi:hypothetical protein
MARRIPTFAAHYASDKEADYAGVVLCVGPIRGCMCCNVDGQRRATLMTKVFRSVDSV